MKIALVRVWWAPLLAGWRCRAHAARMSHGRNPRAHAIANSSSDTSVAAPGDELRVADEVLKRRSHGVGALEIGKMPAVLERDQTRLRQGFYKML